MDDFIPVNEPIISEESKRNVLEALESGWISSSGKFVTQFEEKFARFLGVKHGIAVTNGTSALHIALLSLGVGKGDEVIVPAFTMAATWLAVIYTGARPVFIDCELETYNIDPSLIERKISPKTKAIMPVHIYGHPVDMDPIVRLAKKYNLAVVEDAAEAHGAEYKDKKCGSIGKINCFSFYGNKIITTGEGGMVVTNDDDLANKARKFRDLYHSDKKRFIHENVGYNYRFTNLQAALGCGELNHIKKYIRKKQRMAKLYEKYLKGIKGLTLPKTKNYAKNVYWMYGVLVEENLFGLNRDNLRIKLKEAGVDTRDFFYAPDDQIILRQYLKKGEDFPNTKTIAQKGLYLPSGLAIMESQIKKVCDIIKNLYKSNNYEN